MRCPVVLIVSILTRPWGRVQLCRCSLLRHRMRYRFNPHPPVGAGAADGRARRRRLRSRFNPHPPVGAGATPLLPAEHGITSVFQSSPARGGGCNMGGATPHATPTSVSILTRPWGRVQHTRTACRSSDKSFQSSPARGGGCNSKANGGKIFGELFQSSPARGGGCNAILCPCRQNCSTVSILTRPWGRVQPGRRLHWFGRAVGFNPHPPVGAGAT